MPETEIFASESDENAAGALDQGPSVAGGYDVFVSGPLDQIAISSLGALVLDRKLSYDDPATYGPTYDSLVDELAKTVHSRGDDGPWIYRFPDRVVSGLAALSPEEADAIAGEWGETEEFTEQWGLGPEAATEATHALRDLAARASSSNHRVYLWQTL
jgi:hypothetical protein